MRHRVRIPCILPTPIIFSLIFPVKSPSTSHQSSRIFPILHIFRLTAFLSPDDNLITEGQIKLLRASKQLLRHLIMQPPFSDYLVAHKIFRANNIFLPICFSQIFPGPQFFNLVFWDIWNFHTSNQQF